jgi:hypothetical protein
MELAPPRLCLPYEHSNLIMACFTTAAGRVKLLRELVVILIVEGGHIE